MPENLHKQETVVGEQVASPVLDKIISLKRELIFGGIIIVVAIALYAIITLSQQSTEQAAWKKIFVAGYESRRNQTPLPEGLAKVMEECKGARALFFARMLDYADLGKSVNADDLEKAAQACRDFLAENSSNPFAGQVHVDYGTILSNQGKFEEAIAQYKQVSSKGPDYLKGEALLFEGLCLEKINKDSEALDVFGRLAGGANGLYLGNIVEFASFKRAEILQKQGQAASEAKPAAETEAKPAVEAEKPAEEAAPVAKPAE